MKLVLRLAMSASLFVPLFAFPHFEGREQTNSGGAIYVPPPATDVGQKQIPDAAHPYKAPGPNDQRGPCTGLNTLANHGYLPRNGIVSFGDIINAVQEGFNMEYTVVASIAGIAMLARGNVLVDKLSIGGPSPLVPALPGNLDGVPGGLATHGRFEGDVSFTREDAAIGDNQHFQEELFDVLLAYQKLYGNDTVVTPRVFEEFKAARFADSYARNPNLTYHYNRASISLGKAAFSLAFMANSTEGNLTVPVMTSFYKYERFPDNWYRRAAPLHIESINQYVGLVIGQNAPPPGAKNASGVYINDVLTGCDLYLDLMEHSIPASLVSSRATPVIRNNTEILLAAIKLITGSNCNTTAPSLVT